MIKLSRPHDNFHAPDVDFELQVLAAARGYTGAAFEELKADTEKLYAGTNGHSFELNGLPPTDALTDEATKREMNAQSWTSLRSQGYFSEVPGLGSRIIHDPDLQGADLRKLLEEFPPSTLSGITPLDKGISFRAVASAVEKIMAETNASLNSAIEQVKESLEELHKDGEQDDGDEGEDESEKEGKAESDAKSEEKEDDSETGEKPGSGDPSPAPEDLLLFNLSPDDIAFMYAKKLLANMKTVTTGQDKVPYQDPEGVDIKYELLEDPSQLSLVDPADLANPLLLKEFIEENLYAPKRYSKGYVKRCRFLFIDNSGSMGIPALKLGFVRAMLEHLKAGLKEDNILIVARFEQGLYDYHKFDKKKSIDGFINTYRFAGGGHTEVGKCIEQAIGMAKARNFNGFRIPPDYQIELVILNDGQDAVVLKKYDWPIHAICLDQHNPQLQRVCEMSKGTYHTVKM